MRKQGIDNSSRLLNTVHKASSQTSTEYRLQGLPSPVFGGAKKEGCFNLKLKVSLSLYYSVQSLSHCFLSILVNLYLLSQAEIILRWFIRINTITTLQKKNKEGGRSIKQKKQTISMLCCFILLMLGSSNCLQLQCSQLLSSQRAAPRPIWIYNYIRI